MLPVSVKGASCLAGARFLAGVYFAEQGNEQLNKNGRSCSEHTNVAIAVCVPDTDFVYDCLFLKYAYLHVPCVRLGRTHMCPHTEVHI